MEKITQFLMTANLPHAKIKHKHFHETLWIRLNWIW